ncbi:DNA-directed RNA polymerase II subunit RPB1-like [Manduca sexta]|uniref:DNA-directed RNA polymerase II subunit RPB1-like n=1 Tax=Manduca sexta TaxID=7130 RepID=UPI001181E53B|nr:DNA-directed RNA polymerase II subunit RPB1-like [Manduca sexta]
MAKIGTEVYKFILVTTLLYYSETCNCDQGNVFVSNLNDNVQGPYYNLFEHPISERIRLLFNRNQNRQLPIEKFKNEGERNIQDLFKKLKISANSRTESLKTQKQHRLLPRRLVRQAYPEYKPSLYPSLPTPPPSYHQQPYYNNNFPQSNLTSYTPPFNPQWRPTNMHNYSQPGYPGYPGSNNGNNYPVNPSSYNPTYPHPRPSAPVSPNPADNPIFGHGHGHRYPYQTPTNYSFGPQNPSGYQPPLDSLNNYNRPSNWSSYGVRNNSFNYNPSQRPYYPSGNSTPSPYRPSYPPHSSTQRYSAPYSTTQRTPFPYNPNQFGPYNNSQTGFYPNGPNVPGYNNRPTSGGHQGPYNQAPYHSNHNVTGFQTRPVNSSYSHQTWPHDASHNGNRPYNPAQYPSSPYGNNFPNNYNSNPGQSNSYGYNLTGVSPYQGVSFNGYNNATQPYNQYPGSTPGFYPKPQNNGTSTYRLADYYTPNIPNQPPRKDNFGQDNLYYPSNATLDPTRVSPHRFSY